MANKKHLTYEEKIIKALKSLPNPLIDNKHRIIIVLDNNRERSNESRFEHIAVSRHELLPSDIKQIPKRTETSILKKDKERTNTYNIYIARNGHVGEYIKISIEIDFKKSNIGFVKTIYITRNNK